ncbi:25S rRNA (uridine(2843)-N(3))-methyltransferase [Vanrija pseudolonga]|uniref:25S rRNA (Uridine(2843)-N(3))-methyltransferase n=1 Tax=Vanrija pseudolonga TaxID=143232 RepID=A0AAF0Y273_9TREE|nr:25S rRNA (uridine(2843)-N(3))-methyltransferase [Vanrija pseudolonga]
MTHRSRSFAPKKKLGKPASQKGKPKKLHHPPARNASAAKAESDGEESDDDQSDAGADAAEAVVIDPTPPAAAFTSSPSDEEILDVIRAALGTALTSPSFTADVQTAKGLLYDKKWLELFTNPALLDAYAGRWVPSRALCFRDLMAGIKDVRGLFVGEGEEGEEEEGEEEEDDEKEEEGGNQAADAPATDASTATPTHILSIGGGAGSELLAVAALAHSAQLLGRGAPISWTSLDIGDWGGVLTRLGNAARSEWELPGSINFKYIKDDVLDASSTSITSLPAPSLTTIFFTLTELLAQSRPRTAALLRSITARTPPGGLLLVADSASDIAEFALGKDGRTWPVYMVLDALLLRADPGAWERVRADDSKWWRLADGVGADWPCKLENARYWMRLYRRKAAAEAPEAKVAAEE